MGQINSKRILVVEDEVIVAEHLAFILRRLGYQVPAIAHSAKEALVAAEQVKPDLLLMDVRLQEDGDGIETAEKIIRQFHIPVIYISAYSDKGVLQRAALTRPAGYLPKPFKEKILASQVRSALREDD